MAVLTVDLFELARSKGTLEGVVSLEGMPELASSVLGLTNGGVTYVATGLGKIREYPAVLLRIEGEAQLTCARCNHPVSVPFENEVRFLLVKSEAEADAMPIDEDEESEDVIVGSKNFSVNDWVQEETLLTLPAVATHEDCELDYDETEEEEVARPNPFAAALKGFKPN